MYVLINTLTKILGYFAMLGRPYNCIVFRGQSRHFRGYLEAAVIFLTLTVILYADFLNRLAGNLANIT